MRRALIWLLATPVFIAIAVIAVMLPGRLPAPSPDPYAGGQGQSEPDLRSYVPPEPRDGPPASASSVACGAGPAVAAAANRATLTTAMWSAFGRQETGWEIYAPRVAAEIGAPGCAADSPGFAQGLAGWQASHRLAGEGVMDEATLRAMAVNWHMQRPFVLVNRKGICPDAPPMSAMETLKPAEVYGGRAMQLRPGAIAAWRRLAADARAQVPAIATDPRMLTLMSAYRDPVADAARCETEQNCQNVVRTTCSAHRTGLALDVYLGSAPGFGPDSSADANRLMQSRGEAYRWLVANAGRYGFVNYAFEPWHWEWTGEPVVWGR